MKFVKCDFFNIEIMEKFTGIITDIPYKNCFDNKLNSSEFNTEKFLEKCYSITEKDGFLITFVNMRNLIDICSICEKFGWKFHIYQIWNKEPLRTWISWSYPLRTCEFIIYLKKGNFKFSFKNGEIHEKVNRKSFGNKDMIDVKTNENKNSIGMYSEIVTFKNSKNKIHPTEKPIEFSNMFQKIAGDIKVLDPFCGSGNLVKSFSNSTGFDIINYNLDS
jgi:hypothetical protein